jgi:hypothetical protein
MKTYQIDTEKQNEEVLTAIKERIPFAVNVKKVSIDATLFKIGYGLMMFIKII